MKRLIAIMAALTLALATLAGCAGVDTAQPGGGAGEAADTVGGDSGGDTPVLKVWSFTTELPTMISDYYLRDNPGKFQMEFTMVDSNEFEAKLDPALASGDAPDIWGIHVAVVKKYVEGGVLADMSRFADRAEEVGIAGYVQSLGTDSSGTLRTLSYQATPGAVWYRRSIAQEYLGVSEPEDVQRHMDSLEKVYETARTLKEASGGSVYYLSGIEALWHYFNGQRSAPFVVDDQIVIDPAIADYYEYSRKFTEEGLLYGCKDFDENYYAGFSDSLTDATGQPVQIFCYNNATWFGNFTITGSTASTDGSVDTFGDWGVCEGPSFFFNGGTFWGVYNNGPRLDLAMDLFEYLTLDVDFLTEYCLDTGDYPASTVVAQAIADGMSSELLSGQNHYEVFGAIADNIVERYTDKYFDEVVGRYMMDQAYEYAAGNKELEAALADYQTNLIGNFPGLQRAA